MNYKDEIAKRVRWIKNYLKDSGAKGVVYGNSGGKDSALVGILCRMATENVTGIIMPCESSRNYGIDRDHGILVAEKFNIEYIEIDLTEAKGTFRKILDPVLNNKVPMAYNNINPRLRMITLYAYAQTNGYLVAGTGNLSEATMGYFTKWGDGAYDFNPIGDLTVEDIYGMLRELKCPEVIIDKAPSAGLYEGQTDEGEMGITYAEIDKYLKTGKGEKAAFIEERKKATEHKRRMPEIFSAVLTEQRK